MDLGIVRVFGKGRKERLVPLGSVAREWVARYVDRGPGHPHEGPAGRRPSS